jgi:hypothetical protein
MEISSKIISVIQNKFRTAVTIIVKLTFFLILFCLSSPIAEGQTYSITDVTWKTKVDMDGDSYTSSRTFYMTGYASQSTFCGIIIYVLPNGSNGRKYYQTSEAALIQAGNWYYELKGFGTSQTGGELSHGSYDFIVQVVSWPNTSTILCTKDKSDADFNAEKFETSLEDILQKPNVTSFSINNGASFTFVKTVNIAITCDNNPKEMILSENSSFSGASWQNYSTSAQIDLSTGYEKKTVYLKTRNSAGESQQASSNIYLATYTITGMSINGGYPIAIPSSGIIKTNLNSYIQMSGKFTVPNSSFNVYLADPMKLFSGKYTVTTDPNGYFNYPNGILESMAYYVVSNTKPYLFSFDNGQIISIIAHDYSTDVKPPLLTLEPAIVPISPPIPLNQMTVDPDLLEYTKWMQNWNSAQTTQQFDMAAVGRGKVKFEQYAKDDALAKTLDVAHEIVIYGYETATCVFGGVADGASLGAFTPASVALCVPLFAHLSSTYVQLVTDNYEKSGKLSHNSASYWQGLSKILYAVTSFISEGDPKDALDVSEYIYTIISGAGQLTSSSLETSTSGKQYLNTTWNYGGRSVKMIISGISTITSENLQKNKNSSREITIYPNPVINSLFISDLVPGCEITIIDSQGKIVANIRTVSNKIDVSSLNSGIYTLKIVTSTGTTVKKFVKH